MSVSKDQILDAIAEMSVMDVVALVEAMEEKFGVTAAAAMLLLVQLAVKLLKRKLNLTLS